MKIFHLFCFVFVCFVFFWVLFCFFVLLCFVFFFKSELLPAGSDRKEGN